MTDRPTAAGAMARADTAHQKIDSHEELCAERYGTINSILAELRSDSKAQSALLWGIVLSVGGASVLFLMGIVLHALKLA